MTKRNRRLTLIMLIIISLGLSYYFLEYSYRKEIQKLSEFRLNESQKLFENKAPEEVIKLIEEKIDTVKEQIQSQDKVIPFYKSPIDVYQNVIETINLLDNKIEINIDKKGSQNLNDFRVDIFQIKGEGKFRDFFSLVSLFESSNEFYKIFIKELKQIYDQDENGRMIDKVLFNFDLYAYYTINPTYNIDSLFELKNARSVMYISDYFEPLIKIDIPPNDEGLFEVEGSKLLAILPDAAYLVDKRGNTYTLAEGDAVYLGYLTKIDYENHTCEFLLNKGGILEKITLELENKEK